MKAPASLLFVLLLLIVSVVSASKSSQEACPTSKTELESKVEELCPCFNFEMIAENGGNGDRGESKEKEDESISDELKNAEKGEQCAACERATACLADYDDEANGENSESGTNQANSKTQPPVTPGGLAREIDEINPQKGFQNAHHDLSEQNHFPDTPFYSSPPPSPSNPSPNAGMTPAPAPSYAPASIPQKSYQPTSFDNIFNQASGGETEEQDEPQDEFLPSTRDRSTALAETGTSSSAPMFADTPENPFDDSDQEDTGPTKEKRNIVVGDEFVAPGTVISGQNPGFDPNFQNPHANPFLDNSPHPAGRADEPNDTSQKKNQVAVGSGNPSAKLSASSWNPFKSSSTSPEEQTPEKVALKPTAEEERKKKIQEEELAQLPKVEIQEDEGGGSSKGFFAGLVDKARDFFSPEKKKKDPIEDLIKTAEKPKAELQKEAKVDKTETASEEPKEEGFFDKVFDISSWFGSDDDESEGDEQYEETAAYVEKDPVFDDHLTDDEIAKKKEQEEDLSTKTIRELAEAKSRAGDFFPPLDDGADEAPVLENNYDIYGF